MKVELTAENQLQSSYPQDFSKGRNLLRGSCGHGCQIRFDFIIAAFKLGRLQNWLGTGLSSTNVYNKFCYLTRHAAPQSLASSGEPSKILLRNHRLGLGTFHPSTYWAESSTAIHAVSNLNSVIYLFKHSF